MEFYKKYKAEESNKFSEMENRYDFMPKETPLYTHTNSINRICLNITRQIAFDRKKNVETKNDEKRLREYREYAIENWSEM